MDSYIDQTGNAMKGCKTILTPKALKVREPQKTVQDLKGNAVFIGA